MHYIAYRLTGSLEADRCTPKKHSDEGPQNFAKDAKLCATQARTAKAGPSHHPHRTRMGSG
jgi:hypothetical protein